MGYNRDRGNIYLDAFENDDENIIILRILMLTICSVLVQTVQAVLLIFILFWSSFLQDEYYL